MFPTRYEDSFAEHGVTEDIQEIRWKHYEKKRREKLVLVREDRQVRWCIDGAPALSNLSFIDYAATRLQRLGAARPKQPRAAARQLVEYGRELPLPCLFDFFRTQRASTHTPPLQVLTEIRPPMS